MEFYEAREIHDADGKGIGKWHYTLSNSGGTRAVGYCSPWDLCPTCNGDVFYRQQECETCGRKGIVKSETPCPGHDTAAEAVDHYYEYLLDKEVQYNLTDPKTQERCKICAEWTQNYATARYAMYRLCEKHCNREHVDQLMKQKSRPATVGSFYE